MTLSHLTCIERPQNVTIFMTLKGGEGACHNDVNILQNSLDVFTHHKLAHKPLM
jgi:hypothetical protein